MSIRTVHNPPAWVILALAAALVVLVLATYAATAGHGFVLFDDDIYIYTNERVRAGLSATNVAWAFRSAHAANYHPLTWLSHMLDWELFGERTGWHHLESAGLHACNAALLFLALRRLSGALWPSALAAALFAVHPQHVESVAWASERKDVLSGFFCMVTLLAYARHVRAPSAKSYAWVVLALCAGLLAKSMLVTLPLVLLLLDAWPLRRCASIPRGQLLREKAPLLVLSAAASVAAFLAQSSAGAAGSLESLPLSARLANAATSYAAYLAKALWPSGLAFFYPHPALAGGSTGPSAQHGIGAAAGVALATWLVLRLRSSRPYLAVGWLWYLGMLVPVIGLVQVGMQARADRYAYLPMIGIYIAIAWSARELALKGPKWTHAVCAASGLALVALAAVSRGQVRTWRSSEELCARAIAVTSDNYLAHAYLGLALERGGRLDEAQQHYEEALRIAPRYAHAHNALGLVWMKKGRWPEAAASFESALQLHPERTDVRTNYGVALERQDLLEPAAEQFQRVLADDPAHVEARNGLGVVRFRSGDLGAAERELKRVSRADPSFAQARRNLGMVLQARGELVPAEAHLRAALALDPSDAATRNALGSILERRNDLTGALEQFQAAVRLDPGNFEAHYNLGVVHARAENYQAAKDQFERVLALNPRYELAREGLERIRTLLREAGASD